jgi:hypothetical protein
MSVLYSLASFMLYMMNEFKDLDMLPALQELIM